MTLTCDLLTSESKENIHGPTHNCDQNWVKFPSFVFEIRCRQRF